MVLPAKRSHASRSGLPAGKADVGEVDTNEHKAVHSSKKKKRKSNSLVSKPSRRQAHRETKIMYSIEHSASPSPIEAKDSEYIPSADELADATLSTAQSTPSRRSPRKYASTRRNTGPLAVPESRTRNSALPPLSRASCSLAITKIEPLAAGCNTPGPEVGLEPKAPSPSLWIEQVQEERYQQDGVVELPKKVFEYLSAKKAKKMIDQQFAAKRKAMKEEKRKEKGKFAEQRPINETNEPNQPDQSERKMGKKRDLKDMEHKPRKRQKLQKSGLENRSIDNQHFDEDTARKQKSARSLLKHKSVERKAQRHKVSVVKTEGSKKAKSQRPSELEVSEEGSGPFDDPASRSREQPKTPPNEDWRKLFEKREVHLGHGGRTCSCSFLPDYFTRDPDHVPSLATWQATCQGRDREFFKHVKQISCCRGSVHPPHVIDACRSIAPDTDSGVDSAQRVLSTAVSDDQSMRRAQSSIPPPVFYGSGGSSRQAPHRRSFPRFMPEMRKATSSLESLAISKPSKELSITSTARNVQAKHDGFKRSRNHVDRPVEQLTTTDAAREPNNRPAQPNSSVQGKPHRGHMPNFDICDDSIPEEETVDKEENSNAMPKASKLPQRGFKKKRQRHQSAPANLPSRKISVDEPTSSPFPGPQNREGVLQEIYNNAVLQNMNKSLAPIKKCLKDLTDRFLPPPPAQTAAVAQNPAPAAAAIPNAAPESGNVPELPRARKRKRKSVAERKRDLPELSPDVPAHLRLPDADLIEVGRKRYHYDRHKGAPYAFSWRGHLLAEYTYLLRWGADPWTAEEIKRVLS